MSEKRWFRIGNAGIGLGVLGILLGIVILMLADDSFSYVVSIVTLVFSIAGILFFRRLMRDYRRMRDGD